MKLVCRVALRPNRTEQRALSRAAWARRLAYNAALAWHRERRRGGDAVPGEYETAAWLRAWRKGAAAAAEKPDLALVPARVFEYAAEDLERAWKTAQARRGGMPRFDRYQPGSGRFAVDGAVRVAAGRVQLPRLGKPRLAHGHRDRADAADYASARVVQEHGEWFVSLPVERPAADGVIEAPTVGLDVGVRKLATMSDGRIVENPRALARVARVARRAQLAVRRKQRAADKRLGARKKGERRAESRRLRLARRALGQAQKRAASIRRDAAHQATARLAREHRTIAVEVLRLRNMTRRTRGRGRAAKAALNRRILDAAPGMFLDLLDYKLRLRGGRLVRVNPAFTSQDCSRCGARTNPGSSETYTCAACGLVLDRDVNAAKNILARGAVPGWWDAENARGGSVSPRSFGPEAATCDPRIVPQRGVA